MKRSPLLPSLHKMMDEMAANGALIKRPATMCDEETLERDALLETDPLLAFLYKDHADALARYKKIAKDNGKDSPMATIARDIADSAKSAFETRLIEVRNNSELILQTQHLILKKRKKAREERRQETALYNARMFLFARQCFRNRKRQKEQERKNSFVLFLLWVLFMVMEQAKQELCLRTDFSMACRQGERQAA